MHLNELFVFSSPALLYHVNVKYCIYYPILTGCGSFVNSYPSLAHAIVNSFCFSRDTRSIIHRSISACQISELASLATCNPANTAISMFCDHSHPNGNLEFTVK